MKKMQKESELFVGIEVEVYRINFKEKQLLITHFKYSLQTQIRNSI
jgi:hypothetical protein